MTMKNALIVRPGLAPMLTRIDTYLPALQDLVGGWLEGVGAADGEWHAYCNEEGKIRGLEPNPLATLLAHNLGWPEGDYLVGDVVFLGDGPAGQEADVPTVVLEAADALFVGGIINDLDREGR